MVSDIFYLFNCINHINNLKFRYANQDFLYFCTTFEKVLFWEAKFFTNSILVQLLSSISVFLCALLCGTSFNSTFRVHSYCDVNTRYSDSYRRDSKDISQFLHNRPKDLVKYGLQRMTLAANNDTSVIKNTGGTEFFWQSKGNIWIIFWWYFVNATMFMHWLEHSWLSIQASFCNF